MIYHLMCMASGTLSGDESREKQRWGHNKVYTRKHPKKAIKNDEVENKNKINSSNDNNNNDNCVPQQPSQTLATTTEDANSPQQGQQPQNLSPPHGESDNSLSHDHAQVTMPNGHDEPNKENEVNSVFTRFEDRVKISFSSVTSKSEFREVRRKLAGELEQVRSMVMKLEAKEVQLHGYSAVGGYSDMQADGNEDVDNGAGALRVNSEVGSVGHYDSRPFHGLTISVNENNHSVVGEFFDKEKRTPKANQYYQSSDFVLGTEKFPPPGSNKKLKPNGFGLDKQLIRAFKSCSNLVARLMKHKHAWVFSSPVDVKGLNLHDYFTIIKHPMDLGTIKTRLSKNWYKSPEEFAEDVRLTFRNAMTYNPKGHEVHTLAEELLQIFDEKWPIIEAEYTLDWRSDMSRDRGLPTPTSKKTMTPRPLPPPHSQMRTFDGPESMVPPVNSRMKPTSFAPPGPGRTPVPKKPKAKDLHKRDMTYEEKHRLSLNLQGLPSEKLDDVVLIMKKRNSGLCQQDDEIEVDIDSVDNETLWDLDRFVSNYKKSLSKNKRKAELALQARTETEHTMQNVNPAPVVAEEPKETRRDAEHVSTSVQGDKQGNNVSRSSSSSSSSSDSSSSDSDSGSSSASESDADHSPRT